VTSGLIRHCADAYATVFDYLAKTDELEYSDAIMCFGSRDLHVPVRAAELFHLGVARFVVTTGGVALAGDRCEADVFADELLRNGVPGDRIVAERESVHTGENVGLGMAALQERHGPIGSVISVAWPFAARRCVATLATHHPDVIVGSAPAFWRPGERSPLTAASARWAVEQLARLTVYAERGLIAAHDVPSTVTRAAHTLRELLSMISCALALSELPERRQPLANAQRPRTDRRLEAAGIRPPVV